MPVDSVNNHQFGPVFWDPNSWLQLREKLSLPKAALGLEKTNVLLPQIQQQVKQMRIKKKGEGMGKWSQEISFHHHHHLGTADGVQPLSRRHNWLRIVHPRCTPGDLEIPEANLKLQKVFWIRTEQCLPHPQTKMFANPWYNTST